MIDIGENRKLITRKKVKRTIEFIECKTFGSKCQPEFHLQLSLLEASLLPNEIEVVSKKESKSFKYSNGRRRVELTFWGTDNKIANCKIEVKQFKQTKFVTINSLALSIQEYLRLKQFCTSTISVPEIGILEQSQ